MAAECSALRSPRHAFILRLIHVVMCLFFVAGGIVALADWRTSRDPVSVCISIYVILFSIWLLFTQTFGSAALAHCLFVVSVGGRAVTYIFLGGLFIAYAVPGNPFFVVIAVGSMALGAWCALMAFLGGVPPPLPFYFEEYADGTSRRRKGGKRTITDYYKPVGEEAPQEAV